MSIRKDYSIDVLRLLDNLRKEISGKKNFGKIVFGLDKDDICFQIDQIRATMPRELKDAASLTRETERVLTEADDESKAILAAAEMEAAQLVKEAEEKAANLLQQAQLEQTRMVGEDEVLRIAKSQAEELRKSAEKYAREMQRGADRYALNTLEELEAKIGRVLSEVERGKRELPQQTAPLHAVVETDRESVNA